MTTPTFLPAAISISHYVYVPAMSGGNPVLDAHGNPTGAYAAPVTRMIIAWWPLERRTWQIDPIDPNVVNRYEYDIHMLVPQANVYNKPDRVIVNGLEYEIQGLPTDWASALPFPTAAYGMLIGGEVHCRRVTSTAVLGGE
jgi:hypothetical protein